MTQSREYQGALYAISSGLLYGLVGYFGVSLMHAHLSVFNMLFWRFFVSLLVAILLKYAFERTTNTKPKELLKSMFYGAAFYSLSSGVYFYGCRYISSGLAMVIFFTYPAIVLALNRLFYKSPITKVYSIAVTIIMLGLMLLVDVREFTFDLMGIALSILSAVFYAGYMIGSKTNDVPPLTSTITVSIGCMFTCFMMAVFDQSFMVPTGLETWLYIIGFGVLSTAVPIILLLQALKYISSEKASVLSVLEPVFVVVFGILLLNETITWLQGIGIFVILGGAILTLFSHKINFSRKQK